MLIDIYRSCSDFVPSRVVLSHRYFQAMNILKLFSSFLLLIIARAVAPHEDELNETSNLYIPRRVRRRMARNYHIFDSQEDMINAFLNVHVVTNTMVLFIVLLMFVFIYGPAIKRILENSLVYQH